ncbi:MAG: tRNA pseudouridine(38-40) synthase TruA [Chitinophagaceae bacterium]|nr:tRNA pseudouridine(38-40) synthase TruA [Chitinophagaceae bacterium]
MGNSRYFLEVAYNGTRYSGFQVQDNANSIQSEIEKAFATLQRENVMFTGSSRTDAGVHALQNFFHFDYDGVINPRFIYKMNAILPHDIVVRSIIPVSADSHCRFDAVSREYKYFIYQNKNPFLDDRAYHFPYPLDLGVMNEAAELIASTTDFTSFAKRNSQVKTFFCDIKKSIWIKEDDTITYHVEANRFLRGMVKGLVGTMLQLGRGKISLYDLKAIISARDCSKADFSVPAKGLFLVRVLF